MHLNIVRVRRGVSISGIGDGGVGAVGTVGDGGGVGGGDGRCVSGVGRGVCVDEGFSGGKRHQGSEDQLWSKRNVIKKINPEPLVKWHSLGSDKR